MAIDIEETGYVEFNTKDQDGNPKVVSIDVLFALGEIAKFGRLLKETSDLNSYLDALKDFLIAQGFPATISLNTVQKVVEHLRLQEEKLLGKSVPGSATSS